MPESQCVGKALLRAGEREDALAKAKIEAKMSAENFGFTSRVALGEERLRCAEAAQPSRLDQAKTKAAALDAEHAATRLRYERHLAEAAAAEAEVSRLTALLAAAG